MKPAPITCQRSAPSASGLNLPRIPRWRDGAAERAAARPHRLSRECPGHVLLETLDCVPEWVKADRVIVSGRLAARSSRCCARCYDCKGRVVGRAGARHDRIPVRNPKNENRWQQADAAHHRLARRKPAASPAKPLARNRLVLELSTEIVVLTSPKRAHSPRYQERRLRDGI